MIGFFLNINLESKNNIKLIVTDHLSFKDIDTLENQCLYIFNDVHDQILFSHGQMFYCIGTLINKHFSNKAALRQIDNDINSGNNWKAIAKNLRGQFCLIVHTKENHVFIITDKTGSFPIYKFENKNRIQISNFLPLLTKHNKLSINAQAVAEYLSLDYTIDCTFFNEIMPLEMGMIFKFCNERQAQRYDNFYLNLQYNKYNKLKDISHRAKQILIKNLSFLNSDDRIFADITGGFDTRTIIAILKHNELNFEGGICGEQVSGESLIAQQLAQLLKIKFHSGISISDKALFDNVINTHFDITGGAPIPYHSSELINYYSYIKNIFDIHITGFSGTELSQSIPRLSLLTKTVKFRMIYEKFYKYINIFSNNFMDETEYYNNIEKKIDRLLNQIGTNIHERVMTFLIRSTYSKYYHGSLIGTHNTILPSYSPFIETNFIKLMMETSQNLKYNHKIQREIITNINPSISLIMTSHGYNANTSNFRNTFPIDTFGIYFENLARSIVYEFRIFKKLKDTLLKVYSKSIPRFTIEERQRSFWVNEVTNLCANEMKVFEFIDRKLFDKCTVDNFFSAKLKAKVIYLNELLKYSI